MERLWAPWRSEYIYGGKRERGCLFCRLYRSRDDVANLVVARGRLGFVALNRFPYNNGHLMVAPVRHVATPERLTAAEARELWELAARSVRALKQALRPQGFNLGANLGRVAGAGVAGHLHLHVVPRWNGDTNFMPVTGQTKVISEHLVATAARLRPLLAAAPRRGGKR